MATTYHLSNRQRKDLLIRGTGLTIAIPQPWDLSDDDDPAEFARRSLPEDRDAVESAGWTDIAVSMPAGGAGLAGVFGAILSPSREIPVTTLHLVIRVALARLEARDERRRHATQQWPGRVTCGEWRWPKTEEIES